MAPREFKIEYVDIGFCIIIYSTLNNNSEKLLYGLQEDFDQIRLMRCTDDEEPMCECTIKEGRTIRMEIPKGDSVLERLSRAFIENHPQVIGY